MQPQKQCPACGAACRAQAQICEICAEPFGPPEPGLFLTKGRVPETSGPYAQAFQPPQFAYGASYPSSIGPTPEDRHMATAMWIGEIFLPIICPLIFVLTCKNRPLIWRNSLQALGFVLPQNKT